MKNGYFYFFLDPLREKYVENSSNRPTIIIPITVRKKLWEVALFTNNNTVLMMRILVPELDGEKISGDDARLITILKEHMLSILRITYDSNVSIAPLHAESFIDTDREPGFGLQINSGVNPNFVVNAENIKNTFVNTYPVRYGIRLLSDSQDMRIPLQYRYLSLYKLLELEFKEEGRWQKATYQNFLLKFENKFRDLKLTSLKLERYIHNLRDKCAHIKNRKELGVTELNPKASFEVEQFLPLMIDMCVTKINEKYQNMNFKILSKVDNKQGDFVINKTVK